MTDATLNELCHHLLNGVMVIKSLCLQGRTGGMTPEQMIGKIEHRCNGMEQAFRAIVDRHGLTSPCTPSGGGQKEI